MNTTPQPRRRRRAVAPENVFEENSVVEQPETVKKPVPAAPAAEQTKQEPVKAKQEAAELEWADDDFAAEKAEKPAKKSKGKSGKGKSKKKKKKGGCLKTVLLLLILFLIAAAALCWYLFPQRSQALLEQTIGKVIPLATATP